jgi:D-xylose transport system substrate-binding protein
MIAVAAIVVGCSSSATASPVVTAPPAATPVSSAPAAAATPTPAPTPQPTVIPADMSAMAPIKALNTGKGEVDVILPDVTTSARYAVYDAPYLAQAFLAAGYAASDFKIQNASGATGTEVAIAQADITGGAKILVVDPLDGPTGKQIQALADAAGVIMISYDRATFQGTKTYYVSFNNVQVGKLIGQGFLDCAKAWGVTSAKVFTVDGGQDTDPNAIDFAKGYNSVVWGQQVAQVKAGATNSAGMTLVGEQLAPGWDNAQGGTIFQQALTAHPEINATIEANDGLAGAVIADLKAAGVAAKKVPTVGQDASPAGLAFVLQGFQCGSVYKPIYLEAEAAVTLATYLRAGTTPPATLLNGTTTDPTNAAVTEPAVLLTPMWVTSANMETTVIKDGAVQAADLCAAAGADVCAAAGIK